MTMMFGEILERADSLKMGHDITERRRIRAIMNGGPEGVQAVLGWGVDGPEGDMEDLGVDLPTANIVWSGVERLAQRLGKMPILKMEHLPIKDNDTARERAEKRARIVNAWDEMGRMELHYPQMGRWVPGYGFAFHVIKERKIGDYIFPVAELRDPYDVYPGFWGPDQQPREVATIRKVPYQNLKAIWGDLGPRRDLKRAHGVVILGESWEGQGDVEVIEYMNAEGTWIICRETQQILTHIPNPLSEPAFVLTKRFSFDALKGQYTHVIGLLSQSARLNLLGMIATEDSNFRETNVFGEMDSDEYETGREAINFFQAGARVEKPTGDLIQQTFQAINVLERQIRIVGQYDVGQDGISPNSFATGEGIKNLGSAFNNNIAEYHMAFKHSQQLIDRKRLEWDEVMHPKLNRRIFWYEGSKANEETYTPEKDIAGDYRTKRVYGAMATFDETSKILAGLQLLGARVIDRRTLQAQIDGLADESVTLINERILQDEAEIQLMGLLSNKGMQGDAKAEMALVDIYLKPGDAETTLKTFYTPEEPQMSPEQVAMAQGLGPGGPAPEGPAPPIQTVLAQMEAEGGGAQTVAVNR